MAILHDSLRSTFLQKQEELTASGQILSRESLHHYHSVFREKFGPDVLRNLDGEQLLVTMHDLGNRDSLVYWLEFKNDEEFPARFGSIAGGSALKFGLFKRKETGEWSTFGDKSRGKPKAISVDEALEIARKHRDQLIAACGPLDELPSLGTDQDYALLQEQLERLAPSVCDLSWGHKYLSLLYPEKLDDYHSPDYQRFHLLKLLQLPPANKGRFVCAGRFVAIANELNSHINSLTYVLNQIHPMHRYWRVGTSDGKEALNHWPEMRDGGLVAIGWPLVGDLSDVDSKKASKDVIKQQLTEAYPSKKPPWIGKSASQLLRFAAVAAEDDLVLACDGGTVHGVGRFTDSYYYDAGADFPHRRQVEWLSLHEWKMPEQEALRSTFREIRKYDNILQAERVVVEGAPVSKTNGKTIDERRTLPRLTGVIGRINSVLERKSQVILYGPPGTGKTYWAEKAAEELAARRMYGTTFSDLDASQLESICGNADTPGVVRFCCFHPAYGYEDFIEGYRPTTVDGVLSFSLTPGVFNLLCQDAEAEPEKDFFLIIDEINRGDIPRIFGELLTILEKDKRDKRLSLPLSGASFSVPPNVFVIGTMNTADRSITLLDAALRRRFGFIEMLPDSTLFQGHSIAGLPLGPWLDALNDRIRNYVGRDASGLQVGHSYLMKGGHPIGELATLRRVLRDDILPLVQEYCYEDFTALHSILGNGLVDTEKHRIQDAILEPGREEDLIQALLAPCPEISTSSAALDSEEDGAEAIDDDDADGE